MPLLKKFHRVILTAFIVTFITVACLPATPSEFIGTPSSTLISNAHTATPSEPVIVTPTLGYSIGDPTATPPGGDIADPHYQEGKEADKAKNYEQVLISMQAVLDANPDLAPPHWYRGRAFFYLDDCISGLAEMEKALAIDSNYALAWADHGMVNSCLGNLTEAFQDYVKALDLDPSLAKVHHNLGAFYFNQGDYSQALYHHELATKIDPTRASSWSSRAHALGKMGNLPACMESANKALALDEKLWEAYRTRSVCESESGNFEAAAEDLELYLAAVPDDSPAWYNYGIALRNINDLEGALIAYTTTLDLDPNFYEALINRGVVYLKLSEYQKAFDDESAALLFGDIPLAFMNRGNASLGLGNLELAIDDYESAVALAPYSPGPFFYLATTYFEVERYEEALFAADNLNLLEPSNHQNQGLLEIQARSHYALGNYLDAISYMNKALEVGEFQLGYYYRGVIHLAAGNDDEARQDLEHFLLLSEGSTSLDKQRKEAKELLSDL